MAKGKPKYKVHSPTIDDAINFAGVLSAGGLAGQAQNALARMERDGMAAGVSAIASLIMGALANRNSREEVRDFLFSIWRTTEDEQALDKDRGLDGRLKPAYDSEGNYEDGAPFTRKLRRFHELPPAALVGLGVAFYQTEEFKDFLSLLREFNLTPSTEPQTESNGSTDLEAVK